MTRALAIATVLLFLSPVRAGEEEVRPERPRLVAQLGHANSVSDVALSPDGSLLATCGLNKTARLWEVATGRELRRFEGHTKRVGSVRFSPDGQSLLTASPDQTVRLWSVRTGTELRRYGKDNSILSCALFSPDGGTVVTGDWLGRVRQWDTATGKELRAYAGHDGEPVYTLLYSADGRRLFTGSRDKTARIWDTATGRELARIESNGEGVSAIAVAPDGTLIATASRDGYLQVWDATTYEDLTTYWDTLVRDSLDLAFSADGTSILAGDGDGTIRLHDADTGEVTRRFSGHTSACIRVGFTADGGRVFSGSADGTARMWDAATGVETMRFESRVSPPNAVVFSPDDATVLIPGWDGTLSVWDLSAGEMVRRIQACENWAASAAFSSDGRYALVGGPDWAGLWDLASGRKLHDFAGHTGVVKTVAFSPDGRVLLTADSSLDCVPRLWDRASGRELRHLECESPMGLGLVLAAFTSNARNLLTVEDSGSVALFDLVGDAEPQTRRIPDWDVYWDAALSPDERSILVGSAQVATILDATTLEERVRLEGHAREIGAVAFTPDGRRALTGSADLTARVWDLSTGREVHRLPGHAERVNAIAGSHDGRWILTGSWDGTARLWSADTGEELCSLLALSDGGWAVVTPDGRFDTNDLEEVGGLHWVMPDDPLRALSIEVFMRDYYEPRLLQRLLARESFPQVRDLTALNRAQPHVKVVSVEPDPTGQGVVRVTVEVGSRAKTMRSADGERVVESGVSDLRLFRDGQLVAWVDGRLDVDEGDRRIDVPGIRLPPRGGSIPFSAYAFNEDGVKSPTARRNHRAPAAEEPAKGTAYVIAFGVDVFDDPRWNLSYAAADADLYASSLGAALRATKVWSRVVPVLLTSTEAGDHAQKDDLRSVLAALAGERVTKEARTRIPALAGVREARPEDLVILALSTHGLASDGGGFLLLPSDVSADDDPAALRASCISTDDLTAWLRPVDAGEMAMIVDACQSAASVNQRGFKPGPMGSRGFGQLAWNKKMRILAASQASEYALESRELRHGLLTHALVREGLETGAADAGVEPDGSVTLAEWLAYAEARVPGLAQAIASGDIEVVGPRGPIRTERLPRATNVVQRPALFDFSREGRAEVVIRR